jgi:cytochrome c-type biogenesis protein
VDVLFTALSRAVEGGTAMAFMAAFGWGVASILLSPCHLASIPLIVAFINGQGRMSTARAFSLAALFAGGILVTIALVGAATAVAGRMLGDVGSIGSYLVAGLFFVIGLHLLDVLPLPWNGWSGPRTGAKGAAAALLLGLVFGVALGPCTFAYMAPMIGVTFKVAGVHPLFGLALLLAYGVGHCTVIVLAGTSAEWAQRYLDSEGQGRRALYLRRCCAILVLVGGLYLVYTAR